MCGRYVVATPPDKLQRLFGTANELPNFAPTWNMAPTWQAPVVRLHPETEARHLDLLRWGLLPHWVKGDPKKIRQPINARAETVRTSPMFRDAFARRRCLVPIDSFYEWKVTQEGKLPYAVARADGQVMALAGLWDGWRGEGGEVVRSYTVVTTNAVDQLGHLHERMPVVLERDEWPAWLGEAPGDAAALLTRPSEAAFREWRVSMQVNSVRNDGPELLAPVE